jgi:heme/copper-type cytochrome/quinol oxidase subunit 3
MEASHEKRPLGMIVPPVAPGIEIPPEPPDVGARALYIGGRLLAGASTFFFLAFLFAYFYLRSLNENHKWHPGHVKVDQGLGAAIVACIVLSGALAIFAGRRMKMRSQRPAPEWLAPASAALVLGLAAVVLQCIEYTVQHFGPTDGAFASVFCAWTGFYAIAVIATMYWLETQVATELRARRVRARQLDAETGADIADPDRLIAPALDACVFFWSYLVAFGVIAYVVLYLL